MSNKFLIAVVAGAVIAATSASARDQIRIVGSSTVYPFTTAVAEQFGKTGGGKTPVVESTGTGGGMKIFCEGVGERTPDGTNASRRMTKSEFDQCQKNGVKEIIELKVGFDGLTIAQSKNGTPMNLTLAQVYLALAERVPDASGALVPNPNKTWSDIDKSLPNLKIEVLGPPPTSGTRDSFHELFMEPGAAQIPALAALRKNDRKAFDAAWKAIRRDGGYVEAGENDNVIVQKLEANKDIFGIFGFSFLEENSAKLRGVKIAGVEPDFDTIASGKYPPSRPLYVYFKKQHIGSIPGLDKFIAEYVSQKAIGDNGYLPRKGLVPLPKAELDKARPAAISGTPLDGSVLR
jgi:phosphate transport system substrate-binding protein